MSSRNPHAYARKLTLTLILRIRGTTTDKQNEMECALLMITTRHGHDLAFDFRLQFLKFVFFAIERFCAFFFAYSNCRQKTVSFMKRTQAHTTSSYTHIK